MSTIRPNKLGTALSLTVGILYLISSIAYAMWPNSSISYFNTWFTADRANSVVADSTAAFNFGVFFTGLIVSMLFSYITGAVFASLYNWLNRKEELFSSRRIINSTNPLAT